MPPKKSKGKKQVMVVSDLSSFNQQQTDLKKQ